MSGCGPGGPGAPGVPGEPGLPGGPDSDVLPPLWSASSRGISSGGWLKFSYKMKYKILASIYGILFVSNNLFKGMLIQFIIELQESFEMHYLLCTD